MPKYESMVEPSSLYGHNLLQLIEEARGGEPIHRMFTITVNSDIDGLVKGAASTLVSRSAPSGITLSMKVDNIVNYNDGGRPKADVWVTITVASS